MLDWRGRSYFSRKSTVRVLVMIHDIFCNIAFLEKQNQFNHPSPSISPVDHSNFNYQSENFYREYLEYSWVLTALTSKIGQKGENIVMNLRIDFSIMGLTAAHNVRSTKDWVTTQFILFVARCLSNGIKKFILLRT